MTTSLRENHRAAMCAAMTKWRRANPVKLTLEQARAIRLDDRDYRVIASDYKVSKNTVSMIKRQITWKEGNPFAGLFAANDSQRRAA